MHIDKRVLFNYLISRSGPDCLDFNIKKRETDGWEKEVFFRQIPKDPFGISTIQILYLLGEMPACRIFGILWRKTGPTCFPSLTGVEKGGFCQFGPGIRKGEE